MSTAATTHAPESRAFVDLAHQLLASHGAPPTLPPSTAFH